MFPAPLKACITTFSNISDRSMNNFHYINEEKVEGFLKNQRTIPRIVRVHVCLIHPSIHPLILQLINVQILTEEFVWWMRPSYKDGKVELETKTPYSFNRFARWYVEV